MYKDASNHQVTTLNKLGTKQYGIYTLKEKCYQPVPLFLKTKSYIFHKSLWGIQVVPYIILQFWSHQSFWNHLDLKHLIFQIIQKLIQMQDLLTDYLHWYPIH